MSRRLAASVPLETTGVVGPMDVVPVEVQTPSPSLELVFDVVASTPLPSIDITRSVRSVLLSDAMNKRWNRFMVKTRVVVFIGFNVSQVLGFVIFCTHVQEVRRLAIPVTLVTFHDTLAQISLMRLDMVLLLFRTYEFWFASVVNFVSNVLLMLYVRDIRVLTTACLWIGYQVSAMIDATIASQREFLWGTIAPVMLTCAVICVVAFGTMDGVHDFAIVSVNGYQVKASDAIVNGLLTQLVILVRNIYRRRAALKEQRGNSSIVRCLSYRCPAMLRTRRRRSQSSSGVRTLNEKPRTATLSTSSKILQLQCRSVHLNGSMALLVLPQTRRILDHPGQLLPQSWRFIALCLVELGVALTVASFLPGAPPACRPIGFALTLVFCLSCGAMYHRQLLRHLVFSFDFAFLSIQFTLIHLCLCDLLEWDARAFSVVSSWLWIHWVLTFDCMPPAIKAKWGFRYRFIVWIALLFVLAHIAVAVQVARGRRGTLRDRAVLSFEVFGHQLKLRVLSTMLSRMLVTFGWSCRIAWRLWRRKESELLIIQGTVTYVNNRKKIKHEEDEEKRRQVEPQRQLSALAMLESLGNKVSPASGHKRSRNKSAQVRGPPVLAVLREDGTSASTTSVTHAPTEAGDK
ncbi:hypothetical protein Poli38472_003431 [Pythium oligandrum]|uniref:Transmembrane protein n=1 Tax=Pythium oligandrum TaxID=41045 RepID=A0A8K1C6V3_PYTOL|nr:hypothetical protein Poli38472_003431 [Pythium oligandrum]|eukprot:TMW57506.1 hypothetical protein Poli38472_003431 [Pythium oligandrum]